MIILHSGPGKSLKDITVLTQRIELTNTINNFWTTKAAFVTSQIRQLVKIASTFDVAKSCTVGDAQCKTREIPYPNDFLESAKKAHSIITLWIKFLNILFSSNSDFCRYERTISLFNTKSFKCLYFNFS